MKRKIIKRKKKKRILKDRIKFLPRGIITCRYCYNYIRSEALKNGRKCKIINKNITNFSIACSKFKKSKYINCDKDICWIPIEGCLNRRNKKIQECVKCRQFDIEIDLLIQKRNISHSLDRKIRKRPKKSLLILNKKKKRVLKITPEEKRQGNIHIGRAMLKRFGEMPWMHSYPEIFKKVKNKRELKNKQKEGLKWEKERKLIHRIM